MKRYLIEIGVFQQNFVYLSSGKIVFLIGDVLLEREIFSALYLYLVSLQFASGRTRSSVETEWQSRKYLYQIYIWRALRVVSPYPQERTTSIWL
jgi:hypothetical protein